MTTVDDMMREGAASLQPPPGEVPPFRRVQRRARHRRVLSFVVGAGVLVGAGAVVAGTGGGAARPEIATQPTTTVHRPRGGYPYDLVGDGPPITLDHVGKYTWTSHVVLPFTPRAWNFGYDIEPPGAATIRPALGSNKLVKVPGGYSLRVSFDVTQLNGQATLQVISSAEGPDTGPAPGLVRIPNVIGMTRAQASQVLSDAQLAVVVATEGAPVGDGIVLAQDPIPGTDMRKHGVITITVGPKR